MFDSSTCLRFHSEVAIDFDTRAIRIVLQERRSFVDKITISNQDVTNNRANNAMIHNCGNSCLLTRLLICKFNSRSRHSMMRKTRDREQAVAIVFIIIWERERERKRRSIIISARCVHPRPLFYGSTIPLAFHFYPSVCSLPSQKFISGYLYANLYFRHYDYVTQVETDSIFESSTYISHLNSIHL